MQITKPSYLSDRYWGTLSDKDKQLFDIIRPQPKSNYEIDVHLSNLESNLKGLSEPHGLELVPDFQRGHVWVQSQRERYVENLLRGSAPNTILFNSPYFDRLSGETTDLPLTMQCIDGLQRLTSVRMFMEGEVKIFGGMTVNDLTDTHFDARRHRMRFSVFTFKKRRELLQFYLDLNSGGVVHSAEEIARVTALRDATPEN